MNEANGTSDIEGKAARVAATECGQRGSFNRINRILMQNDIGLSVV